MASPPPPEQDESGNSGQKRKREDVEEDDGSERYSKTSLRVDNKSEDPEEKPNDSDSEFSPATDDEDEDDEGEEEDRPSRHSLNTDEFALEGVTYDESQEPLPQLPIFDIAMEGIIKRAVRIPQQTLDHLPAIATVTSKSLRAHIKRAEDLRSIPKTAKIRIAILGDAGAGKSSLLNAITDHQHLAKSLSAGESCTCVPTEYCDAVDGQKEAFSARIEYLLPGEIKPRLDDAIRHYNIFEHEKDETWDSAETTSAKKAHQEAEKLLLTLFKELPGFMTKPKIKDTLDHHYSQTDSILLDDLVRHCVSKLKHTVDEGYTQYHEANTVQGLNKQIDPFISAKASNDLWPLVKQARVSVRGSRVLNRATLIDLPGISDTNKTRRDLTHEYVKRCDYIWIVSSIKRVIDDERVSSLLSDYGRLCHGKICLICTHSDDGIENSKSATFDEIEGNMAEEDMHKLKPYHVLSEDMQRKKKKLDQMAKTLANKTKKKKATDVEALKSTQEKLQALRKEHSKIVVKRFEFLVQLRNDEITKRTMENAQTHMPDGQSLRVCCVSNLHYSAHKGARVHGPKMSAAATGIPGLRAFTLTLQAPSEQYVLEEYIDCNMRSMLDDLALWASGNKITCREELLQLGQPLLGKLSASIGTANEGFRKSAEVLLEKYLKPAIPKASESAVEQIKRKFNRHRWQTFMAFVRKNGVHKSVVCAAECWNKDYSQHFASAITQSDKPLSEAREQLLAELQKGVIEDLNTFKKEMLALKGQIPKGVLTSAIDSKIRCIENTFASKKSVCTKEIENVMLDLTRDNDQNGFTRSMQKVYQACAKAPVRKDITKRSFETIKAHLSLGTSKKSPYMAALTEVIKRVITGHKDLMEKRIQPSITKQLEQLHSALLDLLDDNVSDETELLLKKDLRKLLYDLRQEADRVSQDLEKVKKKYEGSKK